VRGAIKTSLGTKLYDKNEILRFHRIKEITSITSE